MQLANSELMKKYVTECGAYYSLLPFFCLLNLSGIGYGLLSEEFGLHGFLYFCNVVFKDLVSVLYVFSLPKILILPSIPTHSRNSLNLIGLFTSDLVTTLRVVMLQGRI